MNSCRYRNRQQHISNPNIIYFFFLSMITSWFFSIFSLFGSSSRFSSDSRNMMIFNWTELDKNYYIFFFVFRSVIALFLFICGNNKLFFFFFFVQTFTTKKKKTKRNQSHFFLFKRNNNNNNLFFWTLTKILVEWVFLRTNHMDHSISHKLIIQIGTQNQNREPRAASSSKNIFIFS